MTMLSEEGEMAEEEEEWVDSGDEDGDITDDGAETDQLLARIRGRWQFVFVSVKAVMLARGGHVNDIIDLLVNSSCSGCGRESGGCRDGGGHQRRRGERQATGRR